MGPFRVLQLSIVVLVLFGSAWIVRAVGSAADPSGRSVTWLHGDAAHAGVLRADNGGDNGGDNNGDNSSGDNNGNGNSNNNGNGNGNSSFDDNFDFNLPPVAPASSG